MLNTDRKLKSSDRFRIGIVGAGLMGWWHAHTVARIGGNVVGVADPISERRQEIAGKFSAEPYANSDEMLDRAALDILHICTTTSTHEKIIQQAMQQNTHVFVEKPLTETLAQTRSLIALAEKSSRALCPVHQYAFQRSIETILAQRDRAGAITHVELQFFSAGADNAPNTDHAQIAADILPHPISILQRLFPDQALADIGWNIETSGASGWIMTAPVDGVFASISISLRARPTCATLVLRGDRGSFVADLFHDYVLFRDGTASRRTKIQRPFTDAVGHFSRASGNMIRRMARREPAYPGLQSLTRRFYGACAGQWQQPIPAKDIVAVARMRDRFLNHALTASAQGPDQ